MTVQFGNRKIGDGEPCFVTFEAGPTHDGVPSAKRLIDHAADAGADAIKFQILDPDRLVADREMLFKFDILVDRESGETRTVEEPLYDLIKRRSLSRDEWCDVRAHCMDRNLAFFATVGFDDELDLLTELNCDSVKIASADINHVPLLRKAAATGMCLQIDTGNSTIGEVEAAVDLLVGEGCRDIIIHHCPSGYPARIEGINLNVIKTLKGMFDFPIAFSDHSPGWEFDVAAVALGANLVEKTITEDRTTPSVEHIMSIEPADMARFIQVVRDVEGSLGNPRRLMAPTELEKRDAARRSIYVGRKLPVGHVLSEADLDYRRPGYGIAPDQVDRVIDKVLVRDADPDTPLDWSMLATSVRDV